MKNGGRIFSPNTAECSRRQARLGNITWDYRDEKVQFLDHLDRDSFVFCHGDINLRNILVPANPDGKKIGIIDFGKSACSVREFDFGIFEYVLRLTTRMARDFTMRSPNLMRGTRDTLWIFPYWSS